MEPAGEAEALADWIAPLASSLQQGPFRLAQMAEGRFCDFPDTHLSLATEPSRRALGQMAGQDLHPVRFRMNLWLEGTAPWEELDWEGQSIEIGPVRLEITARDTRCAATSASPATGARDIEIPALLHQHFGHKDFGVYATVTRGGTIRVGDQVTLPA
ncbi:MAG: MOSC domain-containing protein [Pseudomonadota bacterium]